MQWRSLNKHLNGVLIFRMKSGSRNKTIKQRLWKDLTFSLLFTLKSKGECQSQESWQSTAGESQSQCRWHKSPITEWNLGFDPCTVFSCLCGHHERFEAEAKKEFKSYGMELCYGKTIVLICPSAARAAPAASATALGSAVLAPQGAPWIYLLLFVFISIQGIHFLTAGLVPRRGAWMELPLRSRPWPCNGAMISLLSFFSFPLRADKAVFIRVQM